MTRKGYKTTSVDIENHLYALSIEEGINFTGFFNLALAYYHGLPEDPREKLVKEKTQYSVLRLKERYEREVKSIIKEYAEQSSIEDAVKTKESDLIQFGDYLQRTKSYPDFRRCLERKDPDDSVLRNITKEINRLNGNEYEETELWNKAITWYAVAKKREAVHG